MFKPSLFILAASVSVSVMAQTSYVWQHTDVKQAWQAGYRGQGVTVHVHDSFVADKLWANLNGTLKPRDYKFMTHGDVVSDVVARTSPSASVVKRQWEDGNIALQTGRLNVVNASYGIYGSTDAANLQAAKGYQLAQIAQSGAAVVVKAAGNDAQSMSHGEARGDILNMALKTGPSVIFAGALTRHSVDGTSVRLGRINIHLPGVMTASSSYTNTPGADTDYQNKFLMVGVPSSMTVQGTSFAAPQISAYAAVVGSKFRAASAEQVTSQLLNTARQDTIVGYNKAEHGRGEASLSRALAPRAIR